MMEMLLMFTLAFCFITFSGFSNLSSLILLMVGICFMVSWVMWIKAGTMTAFMFFIIFVGALMIMFLYMSSMVENSMVDVSVLPLLLQSTLISFMLFVVYIEMGLIELSGGFNSVAGSVTLLSSSGFSVYIFLCLLLLLALFICIKVLNSGSGSPSRGFTLK